MDDPWGSPWAADDSQPKLDLPAPPPQVHTPQTPHRLASPWGADDEDDAWGGWNGAEGGAGAESPGWGRSPGLRPARSGTVSRHVSPDPWGRMGMLDSRSDVTDDRKSIKDVPTTVDSAISMGDESLAATFHDEKNTVAIQDPHDIHVNADEAKSRSKSSQSKDESVDLESREPELPPSPTGPPSQASARPDRPEAVRQASKVQELVHMYDGIAKRKDPPAEPLLAGPRIILVGSDGVTESDGSVQQTAMHDTAQSKPEPLPLERHEDGESENGDSSKSEPDSAGEQRDNETHIERPAAESEPPVDARVPSIPYGYDLKYLDELFPDTPTPSIEPEPVPDVIIDDTFASISERKAWYRMSRRGPMRQHNQGNAEDYVRLDWRSSEVRSRTLHIVRRWMEEDSIAGRVVLGRRTGPVGASMFNWDSQAPQVQIGDLFGKKEHKRSISGASRASRGSLTSPASATFAWSGSHESSAASIEKPSLDEPKRNSFIAPPPAMASPTIPSFGWNSEPQGARATNSGLEGKSHVASAQKDPSPILATRAPVLQSLDTVVANGSTQKPLKVTTIEESEDEDEWGEMVSSPTWPSKPSALDNKDPSVVLPDNTVGIGSHPPESIDSPVIAVGSQTHAASALPETYPSTQRETITTLPEGFSGAHGIPVLDPEAPENRKGPIVPAQSVEPDPWDSFEGPSVDLSPNNEEPEVTPKMQSQHLSEDEEAVVKQLLKSIPDLSYMLR